MKHSVVLKIIAFILATCALTVTVAGCIGFIAVAAQGLYGTDYQTWCEQFYAVHSEWMARAAAESYAARTEGNLSPYELNVIGWGYSHEELSQKWNVRSDGWGYMILNTDGAQLEFVAPMDISYLPTYEYTILPYYPVRVLESADWEDQIAYWLNDERQVMYLDYRQGPEYRVSVWITGGGLESFSGLDLELYEDLYHLRWHFVAFAAAGLLVLVVCLIYLCCAAGRSPKHDTVKPGGLNRLPLDIYGAALAGITLLLCAGVLEIIEELLFYDTNSVVFWGILSVAGALAASVCVVAFLFALAAQWKLGFKAMCQHTVIGWCCGKLWKLCRWCWSGLCKLYILLPLIWRYLLIAFGMAAVPVFCLYQTVEHYGLSGDIWAVVLLAALAADVVIVLYGAYAYGTVLKGARQMAGGDLHTGIDTKRLLGSYKTCAQDLNVLADVAVVAAKKQMRSDRMKTELITNVSHDIKTPLTSVINYIDLLQRAESQEQAAEYLAVLDRQAQKLKKLIDDLMEMSKATTGDMTVELTRLDAVEAVNQALGEFTDKLTAQNLTVMLRTPEQPAYVCADGGLTWRVLGNLIGNIVKYALPGTRVYAEVDQQEKQVIVSLKNISKEPLNISADELTERFVRGDASRNTEGSGLGLNIAKSLMELQKGSLDLLVDGDLFKVTLTFPAA